MANNTQILYNMGGFHLFERSSEETINDNRRISPEDKEPIHPLQAINLVDCDVYKSFTMPTKAEIQVRGKSDQLCKSLIRLLAVHSTCHRIPSSQPSRNRDACAYGQKFRDIHFLVEQTSQR